MNALPVSPTARRHGRARWVRLCSVAGCLLACALLGIWAISKVHEHRVELTRPELELRDGRLFRKGDNRPFHGFLVEHYPDGSLLSRSAIVDGRLEGPSEGWYTNGQLQVRETYRQGLVHGVRIKWYPDGTTQSMAHLVESQYHGMYQRWHENGRPAEEVLFDNGRPHGIARAWYPTGNLKAEVRVEHGRILDRRDFPDTVAPVATAVASPVEVPPTNVAGP